VKELPWCAPTDSPVRRHTRQQQQQQQPQSQHDGTTHNNPAAGRATIIKKSKEFKPIDRFGIVAAMCVPSNSKNTINSGIIGVNGKLPWESLPSDRKNFERLTRNRILIIGRRTLLNERQGNLDHVRHAKHCIVVSKSITSLDKDPRIIRTSSNNLLDDKDMHFLKLARSLDEALDLARDLSAEVDGKNDDEKNPVSRTENTDNVTSENGNNDDDNYNDNDIKPFPTLLSSSDNIQCWVAGGERLYEEALKHKSALELHLSAVDVEIDLTSTAVKHVARFPAKYRWDHNYEHISETCLPFVSAAAEKKDTKTEPSFVYHIYKRIVRQR